MNETLERALKASEFLRANLHRVFFITDAIHIKDGKFEFDGCDPAEPKLLYNNDKCLENALEHLDRLYMPKNKFFSRNIKYSPFEYDRDTKHEIFKIFNPQSRPAYPLFQSTIFAFVMTNGLFPNFDEFAMTYLSTFFDTVALEKIEEYKSYVAPPPHFDIGKKMISENYEYVNKLIETNHSAMAMSYCWPCKYMTTDMVLNRLYKAYPSLIRKIYVEFKVCCECKDVEYSLYVDTWCNRHLRINNTLVMFKTNTNAAKHFSEDRMTKSRTVPQEKYITFEMVIDDAASDELAFPTDASIKELIRLCSYPKLYVDMTVKSDM